MGFFIPSTLFFTIIASQFWELAFRTGETAFDSPWELLLWPARLAMPVGGLLLLLQGFQELFRAFHQMGKERERYFVMVLLPYFLFLIWLVFAVFNPGSTPGGEWFSDIISSRPGISKPMIGLIMLVTMIFVIFIGFPISFTLIFLAFVLGFGGPTSNLQHC